MNQSNHGLGHIIGLCYRCHQAVVRGETSKALWVGKDADGRSVGWVVQHFDCLQPYTKDIGEPWRGEAK